MLLQSGVVSGSSCRVCQGAHPWNCGTVQDQRRCDDASNHGQRVLQAHEQRHHEARLGVHWEEWRLWPAFAPLAKRPHRLQYKHAVITAEIRSRNGSCMNTRTCRTLPSWSGTIWHGPRVPALLSGKCLTKTVSVHALLGISALLANIAACFER
jgi:hypothetical protein